MGVACSNSVTVKYCSVPCSCSVTVKYCSVPCSCSVTVKYCSVPCSCSVTMKYCSVPCFSFSSYALLAQTTQKQSINGKIVYVRFVCHHSLSPKLLNEFRLFFFWGGGGTRRCRINFILAHIRSK
jgi:hypothetical protein